MARPGAAEWSVLELDSDPVPGDPESFEEITRAYQELARTTQEAHDLLASGGQIDVGQGKAMEAFKDLIGKLPPRLDRMAHSYATAADAYLRYLPSLEEAQTMSLRALEQARQASGDQGAAQAALSSAQAALTALTGDTDAAKDAKDKADDDLAAAQRRTDDARQALDQAKSLLGQATALRDQAARTAAETLRQLAKDAPQRSLWEKIAEAFHAFIEFLRSTVIEWITTILDVLSTIAFFIFPPLGEAIGFLSGAIELGAAILSGNPAEIGLAAGGLALGLVPGGRLVGKIMKFALKGSIKDGIKTGTKQLTDVPTTTGTKNLDTGATSYGPGKTIKGVFTAGGKNLGDLAARFKPKPKPVDENTIVGKNRWGMKTRFNVDDVRAEPVLNGDGKQIGVSFPLSAGDSKSRAEWASVNTNISTGRYNGPDLAPDGRAVFKSVPGERPTEAVGGKLGQPRPDFEFDQLRRAPWAGEASDPMFVMAHSSAKDVGLQLKNGKIVNVSGGDFAKIMHHNTVFKDAAGANPDSSITMIACSFGAKDGKVAPEFSKVMQDLGNDRQIYAATDTVWTTRPKDFRGDVGFPGADFATIAVSNKGEFRPLVSSGGGHPSPPPASTPPQLPPLDFGDPLPDFSR
ncbi:putative T7SS-secreted protein [Micromonospora sp. NPDC023737]|uniref:putative T7SS-secreted protein n=1 Tax=unclassified Micromonospora TaxID=2617518 RepID=UPI0033ECC956